MTQRLFIAVLVVCGVVLGGRAASAEPMFLSKAETRCTSCHYSPTGGGLLTPYGRLQSRQELSTSSGGREQFLCGAFGDALGPVDLGIDARPTHLRVAFPGGSTSRFLLMNARCALAPCRAAAGRSTAKSAGGRKLATWRRHLLVPVLGRAGR